MNKQAILDAVSQALEAMGMSDMGGDEYGESEMVGGENTVPIWSTLNAGTLGQGNGPIHNRAALQAATSQAPPSATDNYGMPLDDESDEMMVAMGLV